MFSRIKYSTKIALSFGVFLVLIALNFAMSFVSNDYHLAGIENTNLIRQIIDCVDRIRLNEKDFIIENNRNYSARVNELIELTIERTNRIKAIFSHERIKYKIEEALSRLREYKGVFNRYLDVKDRQQAFQSRAETLKEFFLHMISKDAGVRLAASDIADLSYLMVSVFALTDSKSAGHESSEVLISKLDSLISGFEKKKENAKDFNDQLFYFDSAQNFKEYRDIFNKYITVKTSLLDDEKKLKGISVDIKNIFTSAINLIEADIHDNAVRFSFIETSSFSVSFILALFLSLYLLKSITAPLREFIRLTKAAACGDYSGKINIAVRDEIGELAENFNLMIGNVHFTEQKLVDYNAALENRVAARTAELQGALDDLRKIQSQLLNAKEQAESASIAKSDFLANMSHELRTPMNGIIGFVDLLSESGLNERQAEFNNIIKISASHLLTLINDILDLSKIEAHKIALTNAPFNLSNAVREAMDIITRQSEGKKIIFSYEPDEKIAYRVLGDEMRFRQIVLNLLGNAAKFTREGSVSVKAAELSAGGGEALISIKVSDTGIGIPREKIGSIFEMFYQLDDSSSKRHGGAGLGLAIVSGLLGLMKGTISVESEPGKGSVFTVEIPFEKAAGQPEITADFAPPAAGVKARGRLNVLLAEDDKINGLLIINMMVGFGWDIKWARNGTEALEMFSAEKFDAVIMDGQMPEMSGFETAARIRDLEKFSGGRVPIIALTAYAMPGDREKFLAAGMDDYITKPVNGPRDLLSAVEKYIGRV
jgi:signal transduction histidine kinase/CheY-like chemotaxis protein